MGGIGKSVVATAIARNEDVRRTFRDGIIWLAFGQEPNLATKQLELARALGEKQFIAANIQDGKDCLKVLLTDKTYLGIDVK